ncbi:EscU/YscU/HrcU family type III secretion system export apparatus switch protein [Marinimicrococcus flavescens]|uniref:Flagellar type III secretion system protein FlhB n=1 Tax=Marinimicrococcus flavescens TaxID=3031815 RepID=A0AAP3XQP1_9PROT|nr:flagellar type III secretion system protein FlhB [Marinimicrococcus flavescens]
MAEQQEAADRTEEPTQKKLDDARAKGRIASSREVGTLFLLGAATLLAALHLPGAAQRAQATLALFLRPAVILRGGEAAWPALQALAWDFVLLPGLLLMAAAIAAAVVQQAVVWSAEPLRPKLERVSPLAGVKRLFSVTTALEALKSLVKLALLSGLLAAVLWPGLERVLATSRGIGVLTAELQRLGLQLFGATLLALVVLGGLDLAWQRHRYARDMRMSRQELREEHRQSEGDPTVRQRLRALRMERSRRRMLAEVPGATVVITNPTHYAVALRWDAGRMAAPTLVAKGVDHLAARIREVARQHGVPVIENPPLARALHAALEPGQAIPPEYYRAVAEIVGLVLRLRRR